MSLLIVEYQIEGHPLVKLRRCPPFHNTLRNVTRPAYWYLMRKIVKNGREEIEYWDALDAWAESTPRQFATPEEAEAAFTATEAKS